MPSRDLTKIKHFIRVIFEIENQLQVSRLEKKILFKAIELWSKTSKPAPVGQLAKSIEGISERSVYRHLKPLIKANWLKISSDNKDQRVNLIEPTSQLLNILSIHL